MAHYHATASEGPEMVSKAEVLDLISAHEIEYERQALQAEISKLKTQTPHTRRLAHERMELFNQAARSFSNLWGRIERMGIEEHAGRIERPTPTKPAILTDLGNIGHGKTPPPSWSRGKGAAPTTEA